MLQTIKDTYHNVRRHYKVFGLLALSLFACYQLFFHFYQLQKPYTLRSNPKIVDVQNELASCNQDLEATRAARDGANADIMQPLSSK